MSRVESQKVQNEMRERLERKIENNMEEIKKIVARVSRIEDQMPSINTKLDQHTKKIEEILEQLGHVDEHLDKHRSDISVNQNELHSHLELIREIQRKLPDKVACDIFDREINYLKGLLLHLRK